MALFNYINLTNTATVTWSAAAAALGDTISGTVASLTGVPGGTLTGALVLNADPVTALGAATKQYVDTAITAVNPATSVVAATTANLNATYLNGVAGIGATLTNAGALVAFTIDGQTPTLLQRVLVKNQSSTFQNGVYTVSTLGTGAVAWILTRALDYDQPSDINNTGVVSVVNGTVNALTGWLINSAVATVGTDPITYVQYNAAPISVTQFNVLVGGASNAVLSVGPGSAGQVLQSAGNASNPAYSTATYPATAGTSGNVLTSDGTNFVSSAPASQFTPNSIIKLFEDFIPIIGVAGALIGSQAWVINSAGNWAPSLGASTLAHPGTIGNSSLGSGVRSIFLGTSTTTNSFFIGGGAITLNWVFNVAIASTGSNTYNLVVGLGDTPTVAAQVNGIWFQYSSGLNSGNWTINTSSASTATNTNSAVAVTTGWHNAQIVINAAGTSVQFFMDGVSLGTVATNLPATGITAAAIVGWIAGTVPASSVIIDLFYLTQTLTTPR